jgi:hypothetical protein
LSWRILRGYTHNSNRYFDSLDNDEVKGQNRAMELEEIHKAVSDFESKLKPVTAEEKAMAAGEEVPQAGAPAPPAPPTPAEAGAACVDKRFKNVVVALYPEYVGKGDVPDLVKEFIDSIPECEE